MAAVSSAASAAAARIGAALSDAQYFESSMVRVEDIRRQLDSSSIKDKLDAMKRVIALISLGKDASTFFPDVVKNVAATSLDVKRLVYLYLMHYAEEKQDLALLAINSFQKDLSDHNQHIRALSLRVLSSIRVKVILQVVIHAINNAAKDSSSYVRKAAAHAIGKVCALDAASKELLIQPLQDLLADRSSQVLGSAISAFDEVSPYQFDILHPHYRRFCRALRQMDSWGQIAMLHVLLRYARVHFSEYNTKSERNEDLSLLIENAAPLFCSLNTSVVTATIALYFHLATPREFCDNAIKPLMRLVTISDVSGQAVALNIAAAVAARYPFALIPYVSEFYVSVAHTAPIRLLRMKVLTMICAAAGQDGGIGSKPYIRKALLAELKEYLFRSDKALAAASARAFGKLATAHPDSTPAIIKVLSSVARTASDPSVVTESIGVLRRLLQRHPSAQAKALPHLIVMLLNEKEGNGSFKEPAARASVIWLIGEFYEQVQMVATEALRLLAKGFVHEAAEVKLQILNLAAKIVAWNEIKGEDPMRVAASGHVQSRLLEYVVTRAKYDRDYDVRDKARMLHSLFLEEPKSPLLTAACEAMLSRKPTPPSDKTHDVAVMDDNLGPDVMLGSLTHVSGRRLSGFKPLQPWAEIDSDATIRDSGHGDVVGASFEREYRGVSSADFRGSMSSTQMSSSMWDRLDIVSGFANGSSGGGNITSGVMRMSGLGSTGGIGHMGVAPTVNAPSSSLSKASAGYASVDPESFYASAEDDEDDEDDENEDGVNGDGSEYETEEGEEGEEEENENQQAAVGTTRSIQDTMTLLPDLLFNSTDTNSTPALTSTKEPTSDYDLSTLFGDASLSNNVSENKIMPQESFSDMEGQSPWSRIVDSWKAEGLEIDASFCRVLSSYGADVTPTILRVTNRGKIAATEISFSSCSGKRFSCREIISQLEGDESKEVRAEVRFQGKTTGVRFSIDIREKSVATAEFKPTVGHVIRPHSTITPGDFLSKEHSLKGMFSGEVTIGLSVPKNCDWIGLSAVMKEQLLESCFLAHVKTAVGGKGIGNDERFTMLFAGHLPTAEGEMRVVLVRVVVRGGSGENCECGVWVGCENVLFSANLMQVCKNAILSIDALL